MLIIYKQRMIHFTFHLSIICPQFPQHKVVPVTFHTEGVYRRGILRHLHPISFLSVVYQCV